MRTLRNLARLVKLEHTVFALPWAYAGMVLAARAAEVPLSWSLLGWITAAMVGARTLAMGCNRLIDAEIDARNPRTAGRELPSGLLTRRSVVVLCVASLAVLLVATMRLDPITRMLWPIPVALFVLYPYTKRFTWLCHAVLGVSIGLAPLGAWLATGASGAMAAPYLLVIGVALWVGGFDVIYATADVEFDRSNGIRSIPARFGLASALWIVRIAHVGAIAAWAAAALLASLGVWAAIGILVGAALLAWENAIVRADDLSRIDTAFFAVNSWVGVAVGVGFILAAW